MNQTEKYMKMTGTQLHELIEAVLSVKGAETTPHKVSFNQIKEMMSRGALQIGGIDFACLFEAEKERVDKPCSKLKAADRKKRAKEDGRPKKKEGIIDALLTKERKNSRDQLIKEGRLFKHFKGTEYYTIGFTMDERDGSKPPVADTVHYTSLATGESFERPCSEFYGYAEQGMRRFKLVKPAGPRHVVKARMDMPAWAKDYIFIENTEDQKGISPEVTFKIQSDPIKEVGVNGLQVGDIIQYTANLVHSLNYELPCIENKQAYAFLMSAVQKLEDRKQRMKKEANDKSKALFS